MSIYIVTHKKYPMADMEEYIPIQVGASLHPHLGYMTDDKGDHISEKNPNFCELTALYYIWKNRKNDSIVGLVHYRRFFYRKKTLDCKKNILSYQEAKILLNEYDIILPYKNYRKGLTMQEDYTKFHHFSDYSECRNIIKEKYPEYIAAFDTFSKSKELFQYNMFISTYSILDSYCHWLFDILFELERRVDISNYDDYNKRIFGFLSERLFNVWLIHNHLKIKKLEVYNIEESKIGLLATNVKNLIKPILGVKR